MKSVFCLSCVEDDCIHNHPNFSYLTFLISLLNSDHFHMSSTSSMNTSPFNCTGHPSINVPIGKLDGLPVGLSLVGRHFDEAKLFRVAKVIEQIHLQNAKRTTKDLTARL